VGPQMGFEGEHEEVFMADSCCADGLVGAHSGRVSEDSDETGQASLSMNKIIDVIQSTHHIARHGCLIDFVGGVKFEVGSAIVLLMFCVVTAFEMQGEGMSLGYELRYSRYEDPAGSGWPEATITLQILSICFGGIFALEVLIRVLAARKQFVFEWWNIFDLIILAGWFVELTGVEFNSKVVRLVRLVRVLRFIRLVRIAQHVENLYFMLMALKGCWRALGWSCAILLAIQAFTACVISQILFATYFSDEGRPIAERREVFNYFGSFARSLLTTFEMSLGNWPTPARVLFENVNEWFMWVFLVHKLVVGFAFVGVINAMFVQETFQIAMTDDLTMVLKKQRHLRTQKAKLEKLFEAADSDHDGRVSRTEFACVLRHHDVRLWLASMDYDPKDPDYLFDLLDQNDSGDLSATEFLKGMMHLRGFARAMDLLHVSKSNQGIFAQLASADDGDDSPRHLHGMLKI